MTSKLNFAIVLVLLASACSGRSAAGGGTQEQYETVQEGSAAGVTSTIQGPGETLPSITDTNVDTTTAFALNPNAILHTSPQAQLGASPAGQPSVGTALPSAPRPVTTPPPPPPTEAAEPITRPAPNTDASATQPPTNTAPPPAEEPPANEESPPPADDTSGEQAEEPPPPPR